MGSASIRPFEHKPAGDLVCQPVRSEAASAFTNVATGTGVINCKLDGSRLKRTPPESGVVDIVERFGCVPDRSYPGMSAMCDLARNFQFPTWPSRRFAAERGLINHHFTCAACVAA